MASLERDWHSTIISRADWIQILRAAGAAISGRRDLTGALLKYFRQLDVATTEMGSRIPALERRAWRSAILAAETGLIGYLRLTAVVSSRSGRQSGRGR